MTDTFVLARWYREDGAIVTADEPIFEIENDMASIDVVAHATGRLRRLKREGENVRPGDEVARIEPV